jgi:hypothetical protein
MTAIQVGLSIQDYNEMTPYELSLFVEAFGNKQQAEHDDKMTLVWLGEYFHRVKKLPSLNELLGKKDKQEEKKAMTDNEMLDVVKLLNAKFGGEVTK